MKEQYGNEMKGITIGDEKVRKEAIQTKFEDKLHSRGIISTREMERVKELMKTEKPKEEEKVDLSKEINEAFKTDYLLEEEPVALKYGCLSIYDPANIGGLKELIIKNRGMFQTMKALEKRVRELKRLYPEDRIYTYEIGKWMPYVSTDMPGEEQLRKLNYCMKCYLEYLVIEKGKLR